MLVMGQFSKHCHVFSFRFYEEHILPQSNKTKITDKPTRSVKLRRVSKTCAAMCVRLCMSRHSLTSHLSKGTSFAKASLTHTHTHTTVVQSKLMIELPVVEVLELIFNILQQVHTALSSWCHWSEGFWVRTPLVTCFCGAMMSKSGNFNGIHGFLACICTKKSHETLHLNVQA